MSAAADLLRRARAVLADQARWTKGALARDRYGHSIGVLSPAAVCYCIQGALEKHDSYFHGTFGVALAYLRTALVPVCPGGEPAHVFNDAETTTHADVLAALDRAIALAERS